VSTYHKGQEILTAVGHDETVAVGDVREIVPWGGTAVARYRVTRVEGALIYGVILDDTAVAPEPVTEG